MPYIYESTVLGMFNFAIPGEDRTVQLVRGSQVTTKKQLSGSYLNVLRLVKIVEEKSTVKKATRKAKVADKITKVEEVVEVKTEDTVVNVEEAEVVPEPTPEPEPQPTPEPKKPAPRKRARRKPAVKK